MPSPIRVVVVEDSLLQRRRLVRLLEADGTIAVVGEAGSAGEAETVVASAAPDVVTMDLELPGGRDRTPGGIVAIEEIMATEAVPILVLSAHVASRDDTLAIDALAAGAVDCFPKDPTWGPDASAALRRRVLVLSRLQMVTRKRRPARGAEAEPEPRGNAGVVIALAASTGGPSALRTVLTGLSGVRVPILLVQHIHSDFAGSFATWLQDSTGIPTRLPLHGELAAAGTVYVAPPEVHLRLGAGGALELGKLPELLSRPSCDELLRSVAAHAGALGVGAVLTGMGDDGARGLLAMRERGAATFAQDAETSAIDGMPRAARELGAAQRALPLPALGPAIAEAARRAAAR